MDGKRRIVKVLECAGSHYEMIFDEDFVRENGEGYSSLEIRKWMDDNTWKRILYFPDNYELDAAAIGKADTIFFAEEMGGGTGEILKQMFAPRVKRVPYDPGSVIMCEAIEEVDIEAIRAAPGLLKKAAEEILRQLRAEGERPVYLTFICDALEEGADEFPHGRLMMDQYVENDYAVFRCVEGTYWNEDVYIALFSSAAVDNEDMLQQQKETEMWPEPSNAQEAGEIISGPQF